MSGPVAQALVIFVLNGIATAYGGGPAAKGRSIFKGAIRCWAAGQQSLSASSKAPALDMYCTRSQSLARQNNRYPMLAPKAWITAHPLAPMHGSPLPAEPKAWCNYWIEIRGPSTVLYTALSLQKAIISGRRPGLKLHIQLKIRHRGDDKS